MHDNGTITLTTIDGSRHSFKENSDPMQLYHKPLTRESFYQQLKEDSTMQILAEEDNPSLASIHQKISLILNFVYKLFFFQILLV